MTSKNSGLYFLLLGQFKGTKASLIGRPVQVSKEIAQHLLRSVSTQKTSKIDTNTSYSFSDLHEGEEDDDEKFPAFIPNNFRDNDNEDLLSFLFRHEKSNDSRSNDPTNIFKTATSSPKWQEEIVPETVKNGRNKSTKKRPRVPSYTKRMVKKTKKKTTEPPSLSDDHEDDDGSDQHVTFASDADDLDSGQEKEEKTDGRSRKISNVRAKKGMPIDDPNFVMPAEYSCRCNACRAENKKR